MSIEQHFADAINENPDDRTLQLVYADWLDEQGDPRAEAWRVLIEAGKRPFCNTDYGFDKPWEWRASVFRGESAYLMFSNLIPTVYRVEELRYHATFFAAMNAAAIAWVRCHRDADFEPDELTRVN